MCSLVCLIKSKIRKETKQMFFLSPWFKQMLLISGALKKYLTKLNSKFLFGECSLK